MWVGVQHILLRAGGAVSNFEWLRRARRATRGVGRTIVDRRPSLGCKLCVPVGEDGSSHTPGWLELSHCDGILYDRRSETKATTMVPNSIYYSIAGTFHNIFLRTE